MDMEGNILHEWSLSIKKVWPEGFDFKVEELNKHYWRRTYLFENGDILAIFNEIGIIKIDKDSNLIWANKCRAHHDLYINDDGTIYTLTQKPKILNRGPKLTGEIGDNFITILSCNGEIIRNVSLFKCFQNSNYSVYLESNDFGDIFHTNTIELIDSSIKEATAIFKKGLFLVSIRSFHTIALVDLDNEKVTWALSGMWKWQHQPTLLKNGNILIFDNRRTNNLSNVIEFNPITQEVVWAYKGDAQNRFYSRLSGSNQRLSNGNTLITESDGGRAFEVTSENEIVWEFNNPYQAGENKELVATLFELIRIDPDYVNFLD